jgi:hypothetical protein
LQTHIPPEIYDTILGYCSRDDLKSLRMCSNGTKRIVDTYINGLANLINVTNAPQFHFDGKLPLFLNMVTFIARVGIHSGVVLRILEICERRADICDLKLKCLPFEKYEVVDIDYPNGMCVHIFHIFGNPYTIFIVLYGLSQNGVLG